MNEIAVKKELASNLGKIRKQFPLLKFFHDFYPSVEMSFQRPVGLAEIIEQADRNPDIMPGSLFLMTDMRIDLGSELAVYRSKQSLDVYVMTPPKGPAILDVKVKDFAPHSALLVARYAARSLDSTDLVPVTITGKTYTSAELTFTYIPAIAARLVGSKAFNGENGVPSEIALDEKNDVKVIVMKNGIDGRIYTLVPRYEPELNWSVEKAVAPQAAE